MIALRKLLLKNDFKDSLKEIYQIFGDLSAQVWSWYSMTNYKNSFQQKTNEIEI